MRNYILEFNEKQQGWHYNTGNKEPNTNGWGTICESGTDNDFKPFTYSVDLLLINSKLSTPDIIKLWNFYISIVRHQKLFIK